MTDDTDDLKWTREIWASERGEFDPTGFYVLSEHATIARFEGDTERDREFHRYVDADILESTERYYKARLETLSALHQQALDAAREEGRRMGVLEAFFEASGCDRVSEVGPAIRALIDKPGDPVAEAARVLYAQTPKTLDAGIEALKAAAESGHGADVCLAHALRALAQKEGE